MLGKVRVRCRSKKFESINNRLYSLECIAPFAFSVNYIDSITVYNSLIEATRLFGMKFSTIVSFIIGATAVAASPLEKRRGDVEGPFSIALIAHPDVRGKYINA